MTTSVTTKKTDYDNTFSGCVWPSKAKDPAQHEKELREEVYSGIFQPTEDKQLQLQMYARMAPEKELDEDGEPTGKVLKKRNAKVIAKDGKTVVFEGKLKKNKERQGDAPHFYVTFGDILMAVFKKTNKKGETFWQFVKAKGGYDVGVRPDDVTTVV